MNILHYSLGFPPYRTGGLTKFCMDLMEKQCELGHSVSLLWPGKIGLFNKKVKVVEREAFRMNKAIIFNYELINPLPISYDEGVYETCAFMKKVSEEPYRIFLKELKPQVIHIHTFMGIHKEFLTVAKELSIKLVFTTHDFFPMCPKVTLFRNNRICSSILNCSECNLCNSSALSKEKIFLLQSPIYRYLKDSLIAKYFRRRHRNIYFKDQVDGSKKEFERGIPQDYKLLREYYHSMLQVIDCIHYNSSISNYVYNKVFDRLPKGVICPISHSNIKNNKKIKRFDRDEIRIRYLGQPNGAKGYFILKSALDRLSKTENFNYKLFIHFTPPKKEDYMVIEQPFDSSQLGFIFENTDILIAPSIWYETFGYTVLEAISFGVPVIISGTIGAKDILNENSGIKIDNINTNKLFRVLNDLKKEDLICINKNIVQNQEIFTHNQMVKILYEKCYL